MPDQQQSDAEYIASLTPERAEEVATAIAEQWHKDWGAVLELVIVKTGLSRSDAFQFMLIRQMALIGSALQDGLRPKYHDGCAACREEKRFHETQLKALDLTIRHLEDELGEDWKDKE